MTSWVCLDVCGQLGRTRRRLVVGRNNIQTNDECSAAAAGQLHQRPSCVPSFLWHSPTPFTRTFLCICLNNYLPVYILVYIYTHGDCIRIHAYAHMTTSELLRCLCRGGLPLGTNKALVFYRGDTFHKVGKLQN